MVRQLILFSFAILLRSQDLRAQAAPADQTDSACSAPMRRPGWARICGRIIDARTGRGIAGGFTRFQREDGALASGNIESDGTFRLNTQAGRGTFALAWGCRTAVRHRERLTLVPDRAVTRELVVEVDAVDTLCHVRDESADTAPASFARWLARGPCFSLSFGPWTKAVGADWMRTHFVRLSSVSPEDERFPVSVPFLDIGLDTLGLPFRHWLPLRGDSLHLNWGSGFGGLWVALGVAGDSLVGYAQWHNDVIRRDSLGIVDWSHRPRARAWARRVSCSAARSGAPSPNDACCR